MLLLQMVSDFITHDGGIWCFREEIGHADIFGKIKIGNNVFIGEQLYNTSEYYYW